MTSNCAECIDAAVSAAAKVDVAILVLGDSDRTCGEMQDRSSLELLGGQPELLRRRFFHTYGRCFTRTLARLLNTVVLGCSGVSAVAKKTIVVLIGGRKLGLHVQCPHSCFWKLR